MGPLSRKSPAIGSSSHRNAEELRFCFWGCRWFCAMPPLPYILSLDRLENDDLPVLCPSKLTLILALVLSSADRRLLPSPTTETNTTHPHNQPNNKTSIVNHPTTRQASSIIMVTAKVEEEIDSKPKERMPAAPIVKRPTKVG